MAGATAFVPVSLAEQAVRNVQVRVPARQGSIGALVDDPRLTTMPSYQVLA